MPKGEDSVHQRCRSLGWQTIWIVLPDTLDHDFDRFADTLAAHVVRVVPAVVVVVGWVGIHGAEGCRSYRWARKSLLSRPRRTDRRLRFAPGPCRFVNRLDFLKTRVTAWKLFGVLSEDFNRDFGGTIMQDLFPLLSAELSAFLSAEDNPARIEAGRYTHPLLLQKSSGRSRNSRVSEAGAGTGPGRLHAARGIRGPRRPFLGLWRATGTEHSCAERAFTGLVGRLGRAGRQVGTKVAALVGQDQSGRVAALTSVSELRRKAALSV